MNITPVIRLINLLLILVLFTSCATTFDVYSPGENLSSLTKITDGEDICEHPHGGDNGRNLFFTVRDKKNLSRNVYKKDDPLSVSMTQKTGGRNDNTAPYFCASTNKLAFSSRQQGAFTKDIYMIDAKQGNALMQITNTPEANEDFPCISRSGRYIVYDLNTTNSLTTSQVWVKDLQTGETTMLGLGFTPKFSPDDKTIVFIRCTTDAESRCVWLMNRDGSNQIQLTDAKMGAVHCPCFSPDGSKIVFSCQKRQKKDVDLYVIDKNGNNLTQLTINKSYDGMPYWANDGNIYFSSDRGGRSGKFQIWRFKFGNAVSSYAPTLVPASQDPITAPASQYTTQTTYHVVASGETITQIAQKYGVTVRDIVKWNGLQTMTLKAGTRLKVSPQ